jgi:hypothetical protein
LLAIHRECFLHFLQLAALEQPPVYTRGYNILFTARVPTVIIFCQLNDTRTEQDFFQNDWPVENYSQAYGSLLQPTYAIWILEFGFSFSFFLYKTLIDHYSIFDFDGPSWNGKREPDAKTFQIWSRIISLASSPNSQGLASSDKAVK